MPTRSKTNLEILDSLPDLEALIRKVKAEERHELQPATLLRITAITPLPIDSSLLETSTTSPNCSKMAASGSLLNEPFLAQELLMKLMAVQETSIKLAQADREDAAKDC
jgi:hypothetical protein